MPTAADLRIQQAVSQKRAAAEYAVRFVRAGMVVGLGAGTTAAYAIRAIAANVEQGKLRDIVGVACSNEVEVVAGRLGIPLTTLEDCHSIDVTIDGADEVDPDLNLIKGGGGALLREKIVALASYREVIVADASKRSRRLGTNVSLPVEVAPFGWGLQHRFVEQLGAHVSLRQARNGEPFRTDQGNFILDCAFGPIGNLTALARELDARTGIVEHGLFLGLATDLLVATDQGVQHTTRPHDRHLSESTAVET